MADRGRRRRRPIAPSRPSRAALPTSTASASPTRSSAQGERDAAAAAAVGDRPLALLEAPGPYLARHFRVITFDPRGNGRSDRPTEHRGLRAAHARRRTRSRCWTPPAPSDCVMVVPLRLRAGRAAARRRPSRARPRRALLLAGAADHAAAARAHRPLVRRGAPRPTRAGRRRTATTGRRTTAATSSSSSAAASPSRTAPSRSRTRVEWGLETTPRRSCTRSDAGARPRGDPRPARAHAVPADGHPRRRRTSSSRPIAARCSPTSTGAELLELEAVGHLPMARHPVADQPRAARLRRARLRAAGAARALAARDPAAASARCIVSSPIGLGHAWRDVAIARELRELHPDLADRLARAGPGHARARGVRRAHPPGQRAAWPTSRATSPPSRASTSSTSSRRGAGWTRSCWPTSWSSTTSCATTTTTCGSATRRGSSTTTCTRTRSSSARPTAS